MDANRWLLAKRWADGQVSEREDLDRMNRIPSDANPGYRLLNELPTELQAQAEREAADAFGPFDLADMFSDREEARQAYRQMRYAAMLANHKEYAVRVLYELLTKYDA